MAKSKSGEFYTFDEVLRQLNIDESRLKRLVSEGEIRAFREGEQMRFKRVEIDSLSGGRGRSAGSSDTSLTEISLEEESQTTVNVGARAEDTLTDDLLSEPLATGGMGTAEIESQDTYIEQKDMGLATEPIDFTEDAGEEPEEIEDLGVERPGRRATTTVRTTTVRRVQVEEETASPLWTALLALTLIVAVLGGLLMISAVSGKGNNITNALGDMMVQDKGAERKRVAEMDRQSSGEAR